MSENDLYRVVICVVFPISNACISSSICYNSTVEFLLSYFLFLFYFFIYFNGT